MENLVGNFYYWPISLRENSDKYFKSYPPESINNFLIPIESVFLPADTKDLKYSARFERLYFLMHGYSQTIYSQYFPNSPDNKIKTVEGKIKRAKSNFENRNYDSKEITDFKILKIGSTRKHLFAFAKRDDKYFIIKPELSSDGLFKSGYFINEIALNGLNDDSIEIDFFDISDFESLVFINIVHEKGLYVGRFKSVRKRLMVFDRIEIKAFENFRFNAFCLCSDKDEIRVAAFDSGKNTLIEFILNDNITTNQNTIQITNFIYSADIPDENIKLISHYRVSTQYLNKNSPLIQENIDLILLHSDTKILVFDVKTKHYNVLIGNGQIEIDSHPAWDSNLNSYLLGDSDFLYSINHNGVVFGNPENKRLFILLSPKSRELMHLSNEPIKIRIQKEYENS